LKDFTGVISMQELATNWRIDISWEELLNLEHVYTYGVYIIEDICARGEPVIELEVYIIEDLCAKIYAKKLKDKKGKYYIWKL